MTQGQKPEKEILVVGAKSSKRKYYVLVVLFLVIIFISVLAYYFVLASQDNDPGVKVDPTLRPTLTITPTSEITPTVSVVTSTIPTSTLQRYVFPDCEIDLLASPEWFPSPKGFLGTCGILSTESVVNFKNMSEFGGTLIAIVPFFNDSVFTPNKQTKYEDYLKGLPTQSNRYDPKRDFLYERVDRQIDFQHAVSAEIYSAKVGQTKQIFYTGLRGEYVLVYGGQTSANMESQVQEIINTINFINTKPSED